MDETTTENGRRLLAHIAPVSESDPRVLDARSAMGHRYGMAVAIRSVEREAQRLVLDALEASLITPPLPSDRTYYEEGWLDLRTRIQSEITRLRSR